MLHNQDTVTCKEPVWSPADGDELSVDCLEPFNIVIILLPLVSEQCLLFSWTVIHIKTLHPPNAVWVPANGPLINTSTLTPI